MIIKDGKLNFEDILYEKRDGIGYIVLNRPQALNAFRGKTLDELINAFLEVDGDPEVGVIIFTGNGDRAFCSGADIEWQSKMAPQDAYHDHVTKQLVLMSLMSNTSRPIIALIKGWAVQGGMRIAHVLRLKDSSGKC